MERFCIALGVACVGLSTFFLLDMNFGFTDPAKPFQRNEFTRSRAERLGLPELLGGDCLMLPKANATNSRVSGVSSVDMRVLGSNREVTIHVGKESSIWTFY